MYAPPMAVLPTLLAVLGGIALGIIGGGRLDNVVKWRPRLASFALIGLVLQIAIRMTTMRGDWLIIVELESSLALLAFAVVNRRTGGMVLIVAGLVLNIVPTVVDWGIPTERGAAESAGLIDETHVGPVDVDGARHLATSADHLRWLDERVPLPTGQVLSYGDVVLHLGYLLTVAAILRRRRVRRGGPTGYGRSIESLGRGPAPRKGPGLHPSRMGPAGVPRAPYRTSSEPAAGPEPAL